jgi:hypothetical protein
VWYACSVHLHVVILLPCLAGFGRRDVVEHLIQQGAKVDTQDDGKCNCHGNNVDSPGDHMKLAANYPHL